MAIYGRPITIPITVWDTANNEGKTGDTANLTIRVIKDGTPAAPANSISEVDNVICPGIYKLTLTAPEMQANTVCVAGKSSTAGIVVFPISVITEGGDLAQLRDGNVRQTFVTATTVNATRNVGIGCLDYIKYEIKSDTASDWSSPVSTKYLYCWYSKIGDINPLKIGENNA